MCLDVVFCWFACLVGFCNSVGLCIAIVVFCLIKLLSWCCLLVTLLLDWMIVLLFVVGFGLDLGCISEICYWFNEFGCWMCLCCIIGLFSCCIFLLFCVWLLEFWLVLLGHLLEVVVCGLVVVLLYGVSLIVWLVSLYFSFSFIVCFDVFLLTCWVCYFVIWLCFCVWLRIACLLFCLFLLRCVIVFCLVL